MRDIELKTGFNFRKYSTLKAELEKNGKSVESEMAKLLERLYSDTIPEGTRKEVELQIEKDRQEELKAAKQFAVVHLHDMEEDYYFITQPRENFHTITQNYYEGQDDINSGLLTLDSIGRYFNVHHEIDESVFFVLAKASKTDDRISAVVQFDFEDKTVNVFENGKNGWRRYDMDMLLEAVGETEGLAGIGEDVQRLVFYEHLYGEEIEDITDTEEIEPQTGQGLTQ